MDGNEFDRALEETELQHENEFDLALDDVKQDKAISANIAVEQGLKKDPAIQAEVMNLSNKHKLPPDFIERNIESFRAKQKREEFNYDTLSKENPDLAEWAQNPYYVALAKDELPSLKKLDSNARLIAPNKTKQFQFTGELAQAGQTGYHDMTASLTMLAMAYGKIDQDTGSEMISSAKAKAAKLRADMPDYATEFNAMAEKEGGDVNRAAEKFMGGFEEMRKEKILKGLGMIASGGIETTAEAMDMLGKVLCACDRSSDDRCQGWSYGRRSDRNSYRPRPWNCGRCGQRCHGRDGRWRVRRICGSRDRSVG
jgi:hypothetical protein